VVYVTGKYPRASCGGGSIESGSLCFDDDIKPQRADVWEFTPLFTAVMMFNSCSIDCIADIVHMSSAVLLSLKSDRV